MRQPHAVLVLGMHRSGTSALARAINLLGVDLGPDLMRPKPGVNDRGFWESEAIVALHDRLLDALDVAWSDTRPLPPLWWQRTDVVGIRDEITQLLRARFADAPWWGQKDPRLCRLLPLWRAVLAELTVEPLCIGIVRNPLEVAASLARRDGIDAPHAHLLWLQHVLEADAHSRGLRRAFVHYEALLADWRASLAGAAERLGIAWPVALDAAAAEIDAFLAPDLRHHVASRSQLEADAELSPWVLETYRALERLVADGESPEALARLDAVRAELARAELHYGPVASRSHALMRAREAELADVRRELETRENDLTRMRFEYDARLAEARQRIDEVTTALERAQEEARDSLQHAQDEANANREWALTQQAEIERLRGIIELRNARIDEYVGEVGRRGVDRARLQRDLEAERRQLASLGQHAERLAARLAETHQRAEAATAESETAWRRAREQTHLLNEALRERDGLVRDVARLAGDVESAKQELARASQSRALAWSRRVRDAWSRLGSARASRAPRARSVEGPPATQPAVEAGSAVAAAPAAEPAAQPLSIPSADTPLVSIVIPVFDQYEYTIRCLQALARHTGDVPFETIVVDDGSSDETRTLADRVQGVRVERSDENRGFVDACNRGAAVARGDLLVFLNNDTEVRAGWLEALVACFRGHRDVGAVGAKLLSADGRLQEAGGLIWSDGSGWNLGRDDHPERPEWQFVREVDYCSAACLLVPRRLFESFGGFDRRYAPAYYEDVDLCFAIRRAGLRVLYQPRAEVVHFEGATSGRDVEQGTKRHQVTNQITFREKWADELARQPAPGSDPVRARARGRRRVLVIDARTPMADNDAGSLRMLRLLRLLFELRCHVAFSPEIPVYGGHYTQALQQAGVEVLYDADPSTETLARYIQEQGAGFDVVLLSRFYVAHNWMSLVRAHCPNAKVVLDTVDLHFVRERREAVVQGRGETDEMLAVIREQEIAAARAVDLTVVVSEVERQTLLAESSELAIEVLPTIHDAEPEGPGFWEREGLVYVGSFQHKPNGDAIQWYAAEIEPLVQRALPGLVLTVIGSDVPPEVLALASPTLRFVGRQPDLDPFFRAARLSIAPLRFGAGVKGKINTSMSFGVPVVTTPIGAEGLAARDGEELVVAPDAASFASAIVELYADPSRWERVARAGRAAVERNFSFAVAERALRRIVDLPDETPAPAAAAATTDRERRLEREIERYREVENVHDLPAIYHFWSNRHLLPMLQGCEIRGVDEFFLDAIAAACRRTPDAVAEVASIGAGNCDLEVRLARALCEQGLRNFSIHCIEINPHMIERGKALALAERVAEHLRFEQTEVAGWQPERPLAVCMANHSLHHIEELELLFDRVKQAIDPDGVFVINDMIGRNGHLRWPEALERVRELWREMPDRYKHNRLLQRFEAEYQDWDCSQDGNEGIRAQDILPLLLERFHFETFVGFANVIDVFIDRAFGHNFDPASEEDRAFIERVALLDAQWIDEGVVKPTHMIAALKSRPVGRTVAWKHWTPEFSVRYP